MSDLKYCALTFDDGPSDTTDFVLNLLEHYGCTASFFVIGARINTEERRSIMKRAVKLGCTIENHSYTHGKLVDMTDEEIMREFELTQKTVFDVVGEYPRFFRAPGLNIGGRIADVIPLPLAGGSGGNPDWNSRPYEDTTSFLPERIEGYLSVAKDGHIMLMHDCAGNYLTPAALSVFLPKLISEGYKFVNLRELFKIKGVDPYSLNHAQWKDVIKE